jgi:hypothetical protein
MAFLLVFTYLAFVILRPHEYIPAFRDIMILPSLLAISFLFWLLFNRKNFAAPQYRLITVFMLLMAASVAATGWLGGAVQVLKDFYPVVILFVLLANTVDSYKKMRWLFLLFIASSVVIALHSIWQVKNGIGWTGISLIQGRIRYIGIFEDPNDLGLLFVVSIPMLVYWLASTPWLIIKAILLGAFGLIMYSIYLTNSRGTVLGLIIMPLVWLYRKYGVFKACFFGLLLLPLLVFAPSRMSELNANEASAFGRVESWYAGFQMLKSRPLLGIGHNNFTEHHIQTAHNSFVLVLAETGLIGYFVWFSFVALSFYMIYIIAIKDSMMDKQALVQRQSSTREIQWIADTLMLAFLGFFSAAFFLSRSYNILIFILCAMCVAHYQNVRLEYSDLKKVTFSISLKLLVLMTIASVIGLYFITKVLMFRQ